MNKFKILSLLFITVLFFGTQSCNSAGDAAKPKTREEKISEIMEEMKKNPEWMQALQQKSIDWGKPLDSVMYTDAVWMIDQEGKPAN